MDLLPEWRRQANLELRTRDEAESVRRALKMACEEVERLRAQLAQVKRPLIPTADDLLRMYDERHK